jgi:hypothetical protein
MIFVYHRLNEDLNLNKTSIAHPCQQFLIHDRKQAVNQQIAELQRNTGRSTDSVSIGSKFIIETDSTV